MLKKVIGWTVIAIGIVGWLTFLVVVTYDDWTWDGFWNAMLRLGLMAFAFLFLLSIKWVTAEKTESDEKKIIP
jgi:hypothetical protein